MGIYGFSVAALHLTNMVAMHVGSAKAAIALFLHFGKDIFAKADRPPFSAVDEYMARNDLRQKMEKALPWALPCKAWLVSPFEFRILNFEFPPR